MPSKNNVLVISDTHAPFQHEHTLDFLNDQYKRFKCNKVVHIGDELDKHALSNWAKAPDSMGAMQEYEAGMEFMKKLYKLFPNVLVCESNHTSRPYRKASDAGIPSVYLKEYREWMQAPKTWRWEYRHEIDGVLYLHGMGYSGKNGALDAAVINGQSVVMGHLHSFGGVQHVANESQRIFGMNVGCLIDTKAYAFRYGRDFRNKPTIGCGVVIEGHNGIFIPMNLGSTIKRTKKRRDK